MTPSMPPRSVPQQQPPQSNDQQQQHHQHQQQPRQQHSQSISSEVVRAVPEQQIPPQDVSGGGSYEPISSRWPKAEVLALINLRSGLESRYEEAGTKGPLWEEISAGMMRLGYKRSSKRCKEKWENINKYFKKVKESNKKRPEDSKTCPYFHELDALYRKKVLSSTSGGVSTSAGGITEQLQQQESTNIEPFPAKRPSDVPAGLTSAQASVESQNRNVLASNVGLPSSLFEEGNGGEATKEPEDIVKELMERQAGSTQQQLQSHQQERQQLTVDDYDKMEEAADSENTQVEDEDIEDDEDDELEEERKMDYKIEFQRKKAGGASNGGGNGAPSFTAMVQ